MFKNLKDVGFSESRKFLANLFECWFYSKTKGIFFIAFLNVDITSSLESPTFGFKVIRNTGPTVQFISNAKRLKLQLNETFSPVRVSKKMNFIWLNSIEILSLQTD